MNQNRLQQILKEVARGTLPVPQAERELCGFLDLGFARVDIDRERRCGAPEVVFGQGKEPQEVARIFTELFRRHGRALVTRADPQAFDATRALCSQATYHAKARCISANSIDHEPEGSVGIVCAGTADLPVAEEARVTAQWLGAKVRCYPDVGVAGLHRLLHVEAELQKCKALVVVAGMEGALPSVVAGLVRCPVIAVPTSVGYGASLGGIAALLSMLSACAPGVAVVNIDNGFGGGYMAARINEGGAERDTVPPN